MNQRNDLLNKLSTEIIKNHDPIRIGDLNTKSTLCNHKLAKNISDVPWSSFVTKLRYKADWHRRETIKVDTWFPSSQIYFNCGNKGDKKLFKIRERTCLVCHSNYNSDINTSNNGLTEVLRIQVLA